MKRGLFALLLLACASTHERPVDAGPEWVPAERYCARLDARGCTGECPDVLCDRARADACLEAVEASVSACPEVLTQPVCRGFCQHPDGGL